MSEQNYDRLREALEQLPDYAPPRHCWSDIDAALEPKLRDKLPSYAPPPAVWNVLSQQLDSAGATPVRMLLSGRWMAAAAACLLLLLAAATLILLPHRGPTVSYAYSQEATPASVTADWDDDEASFERALREVERRDEPRLNNLGHELDELSSAREEVKAMLVAYGDDPGIVRQLAEIERERNDIYRRIIIEL